MSVNFDPQVAAFLNADEGEDVRGSMVEVVRAVEDAINDADTTAVADILYESGTHTNRVPTPPVQYTGTITRLLDLPVHCWKMVPGGSESAPADGTLRKLLASQDANYFPWLSAFGVSTYYRLTRVKTMIAGGSQFIIEGISGNPRFYGLLPVPAEGATQTAADIVWYNRSITSDFETQGAAAHAKAVGDALYGAGQSHDHKTPRVLTQFSAMADLDKIDDMPPWTVGLITGSQFRTWQNKYADAYKFPDLDEIPNDSTTYFLEKKRFLSGDNARYSNQYLLYRAQRTTIWAGYTSVTDRPEEGATPEEVAAYVQKVYWNRVVQIGGAPADGRIPTYVAIGASTVYGSVKEPGDVYRRSANRFPVYVANALHMRLADLSVGSTGFIRRGRDGDLQNFMDVILDDNNAGKFAAAGLISIVFGYGNDGEAELPIGEYDDYYPFDETGYHPTGGGNADVTTMLGLGATFFGCLNWCIRYLGTHYPKAQLVLIFAAPSQNSGRVVTVADHTPTAGSPAQKKLTITDPYTQQANANIWKIGQELPKLRRALSIPIIDTYNDVGNAFSYYQTVAKTNGTDYDVFSETGDAAAPTWDRHPNDAGYTLYARYIAGLIVRQYFH